MSFESWQLAAIDEYGYNEETNRPLQRLARYLAQGPCRTVENEEFCAACYACNIDPSTITQYDITKLNHILERM